MDDFNTQGNAGFTGGTPNQNPGAERTTGSDLGNTGTGGTAGDFGATGSTGGAWDDAGTRAGSYDRKFVGEDEGTDGVRERVSNKLEEGRERLHDAVDANRDRVSSAVSTGKSRVASQLERLGGTLEQRARTMEEAGGMQRRAGQVALRASSALDHGAEYIRTHEPQEMRDDLEEAIRQRPLFSVGVALGAGFLLARLLRD